MMPGSNNMTALKSRMIHRRLGLMRLTLGQLSNEGRWSGVLLCVREGKWAY
jgi:hypothetical protein